MQLSITEKARVELLASGVGAEAYLRLAVKPGGCAGRSYDMVVDRKLNTGDKIIYVNGELQVITDPESAQYLDGLNIDYSDDLVESGFRLSNPNAQHSCGCGSSFSCES